MFLLAPYILPIETPPLTPGVIQIEGDTITAIGDRTLFNQVPHHLITEFPDLVLMPGLVNAHCHLEYTHFGPLTHHESFTEWIREIVSRKNHPDPKEQEKGIEKGIEQMLRSGVTTIGDHISFNTPWEKIIRSPLRGRLFGEALGLVPEVSYDIYTALQAIQKKVNESPSLFKMNVSPHSAHSLNLEILKKVMNEQEGPQSCHLAESQDEDDYFRKKSGKLFDFLREFKSPLHPPFDKGGLGGILQQGLPIEKLLLIHGNYLDDSDLELIQKHSLSIVHCPGSHAYFAHRPFPLDEYQKQGINIALGTDSIASNHELNFLAELKQVRKNFTSLSLETILEMATLNGAKALRMEREIGSLVPGKKADIIGFKIPTGFSPEEAPFQAIKAEFVMINGTVVD